MHTSITILGIESSCDDTAAAVIRDGQMLSNIIANQNVHKAYGGVVPELASRAHQQNIVPVVEQALKAANIQKEELSAVAFTRGPGLLGSLLVGSSFAKAFALAVNIPLIEVNHLQAHILAHFIRDERRGTRDEGNTEFKNPKSEIRNPKQITVETGQAIQSKIKNQKSKIPSFPFLCLTVSGGHTQIVKVSDYLSMEVIGTTTDDAAGEAFDKIAKIMNIPYPGGPLIDKFAQSGNPDKFSFPHPIVPDLNFSFSGLKTAVLYFLQNKTKQTANFIEENKEDICASVQKTIVDILMKKLIKASEQTGIREICIAGGVSANSGLRNAMLNAKASLGWNVFIPNLEFCTDNAAMIAITGYYKFLKGDFTTQYVVATARME